MPRSLSVPLSLLLLVSSSALQSQAPHHQEEVVRSAYAAISLLAEIPPLTKAASDVLAPESSLSGQVKIDKQIEAARPTFEITDLHAGSLASIAHRPYGDFVSYPTTTVLGGALLGNGYQSQSGPGTVWHEFTARWQAPEHTPTTEQLEWLEKLKKMTMAEVINLAQAQFGPPAVYTSYAVYNVTIRFQQKTVGPYRASFLFGAQTDGKEQVVPFDFWIEDDILTKVVAESYSLDGLLLTPHENPEPLMTWATAHRMDDAACSPARKDLCCSGDRCGMSTSSVSHDLAQHVSMTSPPAN